MKNNYALDDQSLSPEAVSYPPGRVKIANAFRNLMMEKDFSSITTSQIAKVAGVNEALIYRYFKDKRGLLHQVVAEHLDSLNSQIEIDLKGIKGAINKLRKYIWSTFYFLDKDRLLSKMLMLEVTTHPSYFESNAYRLMQTHWDTLLEIIEEGVAKGEIRDDISPKHVRQIILGSIEHLCLSRIIFDREINIDDIAEDLCDVLFRGIEK